MAEGQSFGIRFLPLFIVDILKDAHVRYHCPTGPEMLEYFSSPRGSCDSFIHSLSGMHRELSKSFRSVETQTHSKPTLTTLCSTGFVVRNETHSLTNCFSSFARKYFAVPSKPMLGVKDNAIIISDVKSKKKDYLHKIMMFCVSSEGTSPILYSI